MNIEILNTEDEYESKRQQIARDLFEQITENEWETLKNRLVVVDKVYKDNSIGCGAHSIAKTLQDAKAFTYMLGAIAADERLYKEIPECIRHFEFAKDICFITNYKVAKYIKVQRYNHLQYLAVQYFNYSGDKNVTFPDVEDYLAKLAVIKEARKTKFS